MKSILAALVALSVFAGLARADVPKVVHDGPRLTVRIESLSVVASPAGPLASFTVELVGKNGFLPSSFDGIHRNGILNGATGITSSGPLLHNGYASRFLYNPAATAVVDPTLNPGYTPDPSALTGLFALTGGQYQTNWPLAQIYAAPGASVTLDFTVGHAGTTATEYVSATFTPLPAGDANLDGTVDLDDFVALKASFGASGATWSQGDFNGDGTVKLDDFVLLKSSFGQTAGWAAP